jgi:hypothetical protein
MSDSIAKEDPIQIMSPRRKVTVRNVELLSDLVKLGLNKRHAFSWACNVLQEGGRGLWMKRRVSMTMFHQ